MALLKTSHPFGRTQNSCFVPIAIAFAAAVSAQRSSESPLPAPTGRLILLAERYFDLTDESRVDPENLNGHREIVVWFWYPATP